MIVARQLCEDAIVVTSSATALVFAGWLSLGIKPLSPMLAYFWVVAQQGSAALIPAPNESLYEFALRQGGAFAILLIVLWFYRRDYRDLVTFKTERDHILTALVKESTQASADMAAALRENNVIVHQAKNVLRDYVPIERRTGIERRE